MNMTYQKIIKSVPLAALLSLSVPVSAGTTVGNNIAYIPVEEKMLHGISEDDWERIAGGETPEEIERSYVHKPSLLPSAELVKYKCTLAPGNLKVTIQPLVRCAGFVNAIWMMPEIETKNDLTFGADTPAGVLQAVLEHFDLTGTAIVYSNKVVAFKSKQEES